MMQIRIQRSAGSTKALILGLLVAALMALSLMLEAKPAHADTTFTVTRTDDSEDPDLSDGECGFFAGRSGRACSLRAAIEQSNATPGADTINFNIPDDPNEPGNEVKTILPASDLPDITEQVTIDGYSQPGSRPNSRATGAIDAVILVELNGINGTASNGLEIVAPNVVVRGLAINLFGDDGIQTSFGAQGARIEGNFIGIDAAGTQDRGNAFSGVDLSTFGGGKHIIGGTTPEARNIISGNKEGIFLGGEGSNKVQGNLIGTQKDGTSLLGNSEEGMDINSSNNTVGGAELGAANVIAFHGDQGVLVSGDPNTGNRILGNSIFSNGELGIDLINNGRTLNDTKDPDTGPNNLQNFPVLSSAFSVGDGKITIKGTLDSTPSTRKKKKRFTIQFFANPQGEDEGKTFLGQKRVTTNKQGKASFTFETTKPLNTGDQITATATDSKGNTSEFSDPETLFVD